MEHLLFAGGTAPIVFPFLGSEKLGDGGGLPFLTRSNRAETPPYGDWSEDGSWAGIRTGESSMVWATFLQSWLFLQGYWRLDWEGRFSFGQFTRAYLMRTRKIRDGRL